MLPSYTELVDNILILDNLDSFIYSEERFMFTSEGYEGFKNGVNEIKNIVRDIIQKFYDTNIIKGVIIAVRPYVSTHFFDHEAQTADDVALVDRCRIFRLNENEIAHNVILSRFEIFKTTLDAYMVDKQEGKQKIFKNYMHDINILYNKYCQSSYVMMHNGGLEKAYNKIDALDRLYAISTQGYRTIAQLFTDLGYSHNLYKKYFTNNILLLYKLGLYQKYSQILPKKCQNNLFGNSGKKYNYPNMFLSIGNSEANSKMTSTSLPKQCDKPSKLTYWLKILILEPLADSQKQPTI